MKISFSPKEFSLQNKPLLNVGPMPSSNWLAQNKNDELSGIFGGFFFFVL